MRKSSWETVWSTALEISNCSVAVRCVSVMRVVPQPITKLSTVIAHQRKASFLTNAVAAIALMRSPLSFGCATGNLSQEAGEAPGRDCPCAAEQRVERLQLRYGYGGPTGCHTEPAMSRQSAAGRIRPLAR